jgi:hypothetical protein
MKLRRIANQNATELTLSDGTVVLFSYATPVAACLGDGSGFVRTSTHYSVTTSKHINAFCPSSARKVDQNVIDQLVRTI